MKALERFTDDFPIEVLGPEQAYPAIRGSPQRGPNTVGSVSPGRSVERFAAVR